MTNNREEIYVTKEMINKVIEALKHSTYDGNKLEMEIGPVAPCSLTQAFLTDILELGLNQLKVAAQCRKIPLYIEPDRPYVDKKDVKQKILVRIMDKGKLV